ncbi:MAG: amino acid-binding protein [Deltaproteobacteria bacterium]|nr:amino acid-binding protein [Deltaproteobacteria bacterium]MBM4324309.1 amino acid-binding protein [Deltaproteobacteria bacterium]
MPVKQISVSLENVPGKLAEMSEYLGENGINIIAVSIVDASDVSAIRFVPSDPEKAANVLRTHGYSIKITDVLAIEAPNHPGGLNAVLKPLKEVGINVNYLYTCLGRGENTVLIVGVDRMEEATQVLKRNWVHMYDEELYKL